MPSLVLLRHGQSIWNKANRFTGWTDVDLSEHGVFEARRAGGYLREAGIVFDFAYTSLLKRAIHSLWLVLDELDQAWLPVDKNWRLNERHYGALEGLNKAEMVEQFGKEQVFQWRRSYQTRPPVLSTDDQRHPSRDPRYAGIDPASLPSGESLQDTLLRVLPCWRDEILPRLGLGQHILIVAHGNSLRALVKHLNNVPDEEVHHLAIPTGIPIQYQLNEKLELVSRAYLGDPEVVRAAVDAAVRAAQVTGRAEHNS